MAGARVRILTTGGQQPEIQQAVENEQGVWFIDTLGRRWAASQVISYRVISGARGHA